MAIGPRKTTTHDGQTGWCQWPLCDRPVYGPNDYCDDHGRDPELSPLDVELGRAVAFATFGGQL